MATKKTTKKATKPSIEKQAEAIAADLPVSRRKRLENQRVILYKPDGTPGEKESRGRIAGFAEPLIYRQFNGLELKPALDAGWHKTPQDAARAGD